jgi:hypothetical protein
LNEAPLFSGQGGERFNQVNYLAFNFDIKILNDLMDVLRNLPSNDEQDTAMLLKFE